ncbi:Small-conductance mechanosensitive channel [Defluviimonas aquaemixtae]|uniref:Small-conductance mechanosensitive channel n=1 Tax=Albidovulum aquaemixtae TaxID=1542388 RepID=A0A2R8B2D0_9RHOB|nr:mechanosensitive ion channel domain-containing protein [Defluviimonas aquaemixtae]SPH16723.1 Small-conductance mechanosensitive channel [Defluviimonas aquaemixtae]
MEFTNWSELITQDRIDMALQIALNVLYAILILIVALFVAGWAKRRVLAISHRYPKIDDTLFGFLGSLLKYAILALAGIFILNRFGIQTTSLVALIGAAGLAIGLALQGTLSHIAAGVMLILFRPFRTGDYVEVAGTSGTVKEITLIFSELATLDNVQVIVPNGDIWSNKITNYSVNPTRRVDLTFGVAYDSDLKKVERVLHDVIASDERIHAEPEPFVKVTNLGDSSVDFTVRVWVDRGDWWDTTCDLKRVVKDRFDAEGIDIPFPTRHLVGPAAEAA